MERELIATGIGGQGVQLAAQIAARNRWAHQTHPAVFDLPSRAPRFAIAPLRDRLQWATGRVVAGVGAVLATALAVFVVLAF